MTASPSIALNWIAGGLAIFILYSILLRFIDLFQHKSTKRWLTAVAWGNGIFLAVGLSPLGIFATELVDITPILSFEFSEFVYSMIAVGTVLDLTLGGLIMYERGALFGSAAFYLAFASGFLPLIFPVVGCILFILSLSLNEIS